MQFSKESTLRYFRVGLAQLAECQTCGQEVVVSNPIVSLSKTLYPQCLVLVLSRKKSLDMTEKLLTGTSTEIKQSLKYSLIKR